jgi:long-subunit acyl-CoA synthetase (AMP-forming)
MDKDVAQEVLLEQVQTWGKTGDAFKMKDAGEITYIERSAW